MGKIEQPVSFFGGSLNIQGDIGLSGSIDFDQVDIGKDTISINDNLVIGINAESTGTNSGAIGNEARAVAQNSTALGYNADALGIDATALGVETTAPSNWNTVIGYDAGALNNGENVVLVGRKSKGQGDDIVAIGENAEANGNFATVVGKATTVQSDSGSAFGQGSTIESSSPNSTAVGQGLTVSNQNATAIGTGLTISGDGATAVGRGSEASAQDAVAIGNGAVASGQNSISIGALSTVTQDNTFSFGDRNIRLPNGRSFTYSENAGQQSVIDFPVTSASNSGVEQSYSFDIDGQSIAAFKAESNGSGGIQNKEFSVNALVTLSGVDIKDDTTVVYDSTNGYIPQSILENTSITVNGSNGLSGGSVALGNSVDIKISGTLSLDSDLEATNGETIWDESNTEIAESALPSITNSTLSNDSISITANDGLSLGNLTLGGSNTLSISGSLSLDSDLEALDGETIWSESNTHVPESALETLSNSGLTNSSISINGTDVSLGGNISLEVATAGSYLSKTGDTLSVNLGTGLQGDGSDNITLTDDSITINGSSVALGDSISLSTGVDLGDDEKGTFGTGDDFSVRYDSTADSLIWQDGTNTADRMELDRSTGDLSIEGTLTEGAAL